MPRSESSVISKVAGQVPEEYWDIANPATGWVFAMRNTKRYISLVISPAKDDARLLQQLKTGFWNWVDWDKINLV